MSASSNGFAGLSAEGGSDLFSLEW